MLQEARSLNGARCTRLFGAPWQYWSSGKGPRGMLILGGAFSHGDDCKRLMALFAPTRRVVSPTYPHYESVDAIVDGLPNGRRRATPGRQVPVPPPTSSPQRTGNRTADQTEPNDGYSHSVIMGRRNGRSARLGYSTEPRGPTPL